MSLTRRGALTLAGACLVSWKNLYAGEFWNKKDPSQWTGEEIDELTTKSPWAKSVTAQFAPGSNDDYGQRGGGYPRGGGVGGPGGPGIGVGIPGIGLPRRGGMGGGGRPGGGYPQSSNYKGTVRWESAQPILDALKTPLPEAFANHYVIGVRDIPLIENRRREQNPDDTDQDSPRLSTPEDSDSTSSKQALDKLKQLTILQPKGRDSVEPGVVQQMTPGGTYFLFGFSKEFLDFGKKDHEITFSTQLGKLIVKTKFDPSAMLYHGNLAV